MEEALADMVKARFTMIADPIELACRRCPTGLKIID